MAVMIENLSNKIIGVGDVTVLPGETQAVPSAFERSPILAVYENMGLAKIYGEPEQKEKTAEEIAAETAAKEQKEKEEAEALRQKRLASLEGISDEDLGTLAMELGINMAACKTQADVLKKVKAALKK